MIKNLIYIFIVIILFGSCGNTIDPLSEEPGDLSVNIVIADDFSGVVDISATANNTIEYRLIIDADNESTETNTSGNFQHTFTTEGYHSLEIRAYGGSGKYIKKEFQIEIILENEVTPDNGYSTPLSYTGYNLVWNDEFEGSSVNTDDWNFETGTGSNGWGNNELQYYRSQNASVSGGLLTIEAKKEVYGGSLYTSARLTTQGKQVFKYGRIDIRALLPKGQGLWPALWMLGQNISSVGWPACGETDIMEMIGGSGRENTVYGTLHWDNSGHVSAGNNYILSSGTFADSYHVFSIIWDASSIKFLVNDNQYFIKNITSADMTEFQNSYFFIFNVAVGGNWPGSPDASTIFPQRMKVDYIRVFQLI